MKLVLILILAFRFSFVCSSPEGVPSDIQIRATCSSISWFDKVASPQGSLTSHPLASSPRGQQRQKKLANHLSKLKVKRRVSRFLDFVCRHLVAAVLWQISPGDLLLLLLLLLQPAAGSRLRSRDWKKILYFLSTFFCRQLFILISSETFGWSILTASRYSLCHLQTSEVS